MSDELRWGVLGTAKIAETQVAPAIVAADRSRLAAVASRDLDRARAFADRFDAPIAHASYSALLADAEIDAVYIPLPNALHVEWVLAAIAAGKHVLCEKPLALNPEDVDRVTAAASAAGVVVMEAFMWRTTPRLKRATALVAEGAIGRIRAIRSVFTGRSKALDDPSLNNIRLHPELGGGALTDLGCYGVDAAVHFTGTSPSMALSVATSAPGVQVDTTVSGFLRFEDDVLAQFFVSMEIPQENFVDLAGETGRIRLPDAFRSFTPGPRTIELLRADGTIEIETFPESDAYRCEIEEFASQVLDAAPSIMPLADTRRGATILDALRRSWSEGAVAM